MCVCVCVYVCLSVYMPCNDAQTCDHVTTRKQHWTDQLPDSVVHSACVSPDTLMLTLSVCASDTLMLTLSVCASDTLRLILSVCEP